MHIGDNEDASESFCGVRNVHFERLEGRRASYEVEVYRSFWLKNSCNLRVSPPKNTANGIARPVTEVKGSGGG